MRTRYCYVYPLYPTDGQRPVVVKNRRSLEQQHIGVYLAQE